MLPIASAYQRRVDKMNSNNRPEVVQAHATPFLYKFSSTRIVRKLAKPGVRMFLPHSSDTR